MPKLGRSIVCTPTSNSRKRLEVIHLWFIISLLHLYNLFNFLSLQPFTMWNFLIILSVFLIVDVVYLSFWTGFAPFRRETSSQQVNKHYNSVISLHNCMLTLYPGLQRWGGMGTRLDCIHKVITYIHVLWYVVAAHLLAYSLVVQYNSTVFVSYKKNM